MSQIAYPPVDTDGRRKTMNSYGYGDTNMVETQQKFIQRALQSTQVPIQNESKIPVALDIGGGYGDVAMNILKEGGNVLYIDRSPEHALFLQDRYSKEIQNNSHLEIVVGHLPLPTSIYSDYQTDYYLRKAFERVAIVDIGSFSVMMYLNGFETLDLLNWAMTVLPPGGRFYITGISPYTNLFPGYQKTYKEKLDTFRRNPELEPFPGYIPMVTASHMIPFLRRRYLQQYPNSFHLMDPEVLSFHARRIGFNVLEARFMRRLYPKHLQYKGKNPNLGELVSVILEKPTQIAP